MRHKTGNQSYEIRAPKTTAADTSAAADALSAADTSRDGGYFERYGETGSPFDIQAEEEETEDVMATNGVRAPFAFNCWIFTPNTV